MLKGSGDSVCKGCSATSWLQLWTIPSLATSTGRPLLPRGRRFQQIGPNESLVAGLSSRDIQLNPFDSDGSPIEPLGTLFGELRRFGEARKLLVRRVSATDLCD